jgi:NADH-quinone oxidoreductase subunit A
MERLQDFFGALVFAAIVVINFAGMALVAHILGRPRRNPVKDEPFECGVEAKEPVPSRVPVSFYMAGLLLLVFDVQAVFMIPWSAEFSKLGFAGLFAMLGFTGFLMLGYLYAMARGVFRW